MGAPPPHRGARSSGCQDRDLPVYRHVAPRPALLRRYSMKDHPRVPRPRTSSGSRSARGSSMRRRLAKPRWRVTSSSTHQVGATAPRSAIAHSILRPPRDCARSRAGPGSSGDSRPVSLCRTWAGQTGLGTGRTASAARARATTMTSTKWVSEDERRSHAAGGSDRGAEDGLATAPSRVTSPARQSATGLSDHRGLEASTASAYCPTTACGRNW
jgi:hypothetical protein